MVHEQCITPTDFPQDKPLTYNQFAKAMGFKTGKSEEARILAGLHMEVIFNGSVN